MDEYLRLTPSPSGAVSERMQALLARAVEEQVTEQRQVQSLLSDVRAALSEVQHDARVTPDAQADMRADLANHASENRSQLELLDERLEAIVRAVGTSAQVLQGISGQLERVTDMIRAQEANAGRSEPLAQVRHEVSELRGRVDSAESTVLADLAGLRDRLSVDVDRLQGATEESTRNLANHVDHAVLVLAEALLRRPTGSVHVDPSQLDLGASELPPDASSQPPDYGGSASVAEPDVDVDVLAATASQPEPEPEPEPEPPSEPEPEPQSEPEMQSEPELHAEPEMQSEPESVPSNAQSQPEPTLESVDPATDGAPDDVPDDDPLWGKSFSFPRTSPTPTHEDALAAAVSDDAGELVDGERSTEDGPFASRPGWGENTAAVPYEDPIGDLPTADEPRPALGFPTSAPYDLERSLFGDRSRAEGEPPQPQEAGQPAGQFRPDEVSAEQSGGKTEEETDESTENTRRRPWWRPSGS